MEEKRDEIIKEFNIKMYEGLKTIVNKGMAVGAIKDAIKFCRVFYDGNRFNILEAGKSGFKETKDFSNEYLDYFWAEFNMGENQDEKTYKIAMFFKDFDHQTGNIHVLPGMLQFWEKVDYSKSSEKYNYFVVEKGKTSEENPQLPYTGHGGGRIFCEEGWVPCAYDHNNKEQKKGSAFYMQWNYLKESADLIANKLFPCSDIDCILEKMRSVDSLKELCYQQSEVDFKFLFNKVYEKIEKKTGDNWEAMISGIRTYKNLKWQIHKENTKDKLSTDQINFFYKTIYLENYGYFVVYGNGVNQCIDYYEKQNSRLYEAKKKEVEGMPEEKKERIKSIKGSLVSGPNYVFEEDGKIYWKLMYE